ncbi:MAG: prepilin-type N-terminal cleavage/methylation domain-containing protein [Deltaproteobacteria bacterium]|nr:prepilin-type N-terminal cleavage/methylation domain-containing protein [Deltaproteobacteria bacterium]
MIKHESGLTLIEFVVVIAIISLVTGVSIMALNTVTSSEMRSAAAQVSSALKYLYNYSALTSKYCRFGIRLQENIYSVECSDTPFYLKKTKLAVVGDEVKREGDEEKDKREGLLFEDQLQQIFKEPKAEFFELKSKFVRSKTLPKNIYFDSMVVSHIAGRVFKGNEYIYFFPGGLTENAYIYLSDQKQNIYTIRLYALSGRVEVFNTFVEHEEEEEE